MATFFFYVKKMPAASSNESRWLAKLDNKVCMILILYLWVYEHVCGRMFVTVCVRVSVGSVFKCLQGARKQEKHAHKTLWSAFLEWVHLCLHVWELTEWLNSLCGFSLSGVMMRWRTLRSRTQATTTTSMGARNLQRWPSWCSITLNNRISCVKETATSLSSSTHSTAKTPPLRGTNTLHTNSHKLK